MLKRIFGGFLVLGILSGSAPVFADRGDGRGGDRKEYGRHDRGYVVRRVPPGYRSIRYKGHSYLFWEGLFYKYTPVGYVVVEAPVGAVIPVLPTGCSTVVVRQTPYYIYDNTYYTTVSNGYVVAEPPPMPAPAPAPVATPIQPAEPQVKTEYRSQIDTYEIHIPNDNGSYTLVTLKKAEKGFIGPQGEFYPEHPTVEQLKAMYGKK